MQIYRRRRLQNALAMGFALAATGIGLLVLGAILFALLSNGFEALGIKIFTEMTPAPGSNGGLLNALYGSFVITLVAVLIGTPIGILAGTYLAEYGRDSRLADVTRFVSDILLSAPSIVVGLFCYEVIILQIGHFAAWAGGVALAILVIPIVLRTTEDMLSLVPDSMREAAAALGAQRWRTITQISYRAARQGMITGVLLAVSRISGETAPLLFTALNNQFWSTNLDAPMANLPVVIFQYAMSPYDDWRRLAWGGALIITLFVLGLNVTARTLGRARTGT
jgi:phosphate transport system permease protein